MGGTCMHVRFVMYTVKLISALAVVLWYHTRLISERLPVQFLAGRTNNFSLHTAAVTSPTA
jgi:hypothetical protein